MTAAATLLGSTAQVGPSTTIVSPSISPADDCLIVAFACGRSTDETMTFSTSGLTNVGSWTSAKLYNTTEIAYGYAQVTGAAGTGTVTCTISASGHLRQSLIVVQVLGHLVAGPVAQVGTGTADTASTLTAAFGAGVNADNIVLGAIASRLVGAGFWPGVPSGYSTVDHQDPGGSNRTGLQVDVSGLPAGACTWTGLLTTAGTPDAGVALEIVSASPPVSTFRPQIIMG